MHEYVHEYEDVHEDVHEKERRAETLAGLLPVRQAHFVIADTVDVAFADRTARDALAIVFDAIGRAHVDHVVLTVQKLDHRVLARDIGIFDR